MSMNRARIKWRRLRFTCLFNSKYGLQENCSPLRSRTMLTNRSWSTRFRLKKRLQRSLVVKLSLDPKGRNMGSLSGRSIGILMSTTRNSDTVDIILSPLPLMGTLKTPKGGGSLRDIVTFTWYRDLQRFLAKTGELMWYLVLYAKTRKSRYLI